MQKASSRTVVVDVVEVREEDNHIDSSHQGDRCHYYYYLCVYVFTQVSRTSGVADCCSLVCSSPKCYLSLYHNNNNNNKTDNDLMATPVKVSICL